MCDHMAEYLYAKGWLEIASTIDMTKPTEAFDDCGYQTKLEGEEEWNLHYFASEIFPNAFEYLNSYNFKTDMMR